MQNQDIIVYLIDMKSAGYGYYDFVCFDFRTEKDFSNYLNVTRTQETVGTILEVRNLRSNKRLRRGAYYALNATLLSNIERRTVEDTVLYAGVYDCREIYTNNKPNKDLSNSEQLFLSHKPLEPSSPFVGTDSFNMTNIEFDGDVKIVVNNVGQANWNEIQINNQVKIVYDIGAPLHASKTQMQNYVNSYGYTYKNSNPFLFLSHWDIDHCHCLAVMDDNQLRSFSGFLCVNNFKSLFSKRIFQKIKNILGKKVSCINNPAKRSRYSKPILLDRSNLLSIYICEKSQSINYSGILISLNYKNSNVVFSGDSNFSQVYDVLLDQFAIIDIKKHTLIVPHHGGYFYNNYSRNCNIYYNYWLPNNIIGENCIISVDQSNNTYGHPDERTIRFLESIPFHHILRTDIQGTIKLQL